MKTIDVSRLWEGIPAYHILSVLGESIAYREGTRFWEIQKNGIG